MTRAGMPKGFRQKGYGPRVAVLFPEDLFDKIKVMAVKEGKSFSAMTCELCRVGILDLEDSDRYESTGDDNGMAINQNCAIADGGAGRTARSPALHRNEK